jgi:hypothetical protein
MSDKIAEVKGKPTWRFLSISIASAFVASFIPIITEFANSGDLPTKEAFITVLLGGLIAVVRLVQDYVNKKYVVGPLVKMTQYANSQLELTKDGELISTLDPLVIENEFLSDDEINSVYDEAPTEPTDFHPENLSK